MAKMTKTQKKNAFNMIYKKTFKLYMEHEISTADMTKIHSITNKYINKLK